MLTDRMGSPKWGIVFIFLLAMSGLSATVAAQVPATGTPVDDVVGSVPDDEEQEALIGGAQGTAVGAAGIALGEASVQHSMAEGFSEFVDAARADNELDASDCEGADRSNLYIDSFCTIMETIDANGPGSYSTGYIGVVEGGVCIACYDEDDLRFAINAGPATHEAENGASGDGMLVANLGGISFDLDRIDAQSGNEGDNSIDERKQDGIYVDNTPTTLLVDLPAMAFLAVDAGYTDGEAIDLSFIHIKWSGNRGDIVDATGPYSKYSNLDDDRDTDLNEALCAGQPTNPTNGAAHCRDWDGDGQEPNDEDPRSPGADISLSFSSSSPVTASASSVEAPVTPTFDLQCSGSGKVYLQLSFDSGATWNYRLDDDDNAIASSDSCMDIDGLDAGVFLNAQSQDQAVQVRAITSFGSASDGVAFTVRANEAPTGSASVSCTDSDASDPCNEDGHRGFSGVEHTFTVTVDGVGESDQAVKSVSIAVDGVDHDSGTRGVQDLALSDNGDGTWSGSHSYSSGAAHTWQAKIKDTGGATGTTQKDVFTVREAQPCTPTSMLGICAEDITIPVDPVVILDGIIETVNDNVTRLVGIVGSALGFANETAEETVRTAGDEADRVAQQATNIANDTVLTLTEAPEELKEHVESVRRSLEASAERAVRVAEGEATNTTSDVVEFVLSTPGIVESVPDVREYLLGDCVLLADVADSADAATNESKEHELCPEGSLADSGVPGDQIDFRDTDGDASNDGEPNGQVDALEMYVAYLDDRDGRTTIHVMEPPSGVQPSMVEILRVSVGDHGGSAVKERLVISGGGEVVCIHQGLDGAARLGQGASEQEACQNALSAWPLITDQGVGEALGQELGYADPKPLFVFHDDDRDNIIDSVSVHIPDLSSCEPDVDPGANSPDDPFAVYGDGAFACAGHFLISETIHADGSPSLPGEDLPEDEGGSSNDTSDDGSDGDTNKTDDGTAPPETPEAPEAPEQEAPEQPDAPDADARNIVPEEACENDGVLSICLTERKGLISGPLGLDFGIKVFIGNIGGPRI